MWILTREINDYSQDGEYFVAAWTSKPSATKLAKHFECANNDFLHHILNGGGRQGTEDEWFHLFNYKE